MEWGPVLGALFAAGGEATSLQHSKLVKRAVKSARKQQKRPKEELRASLQAFLRG